MLNYRTCTFPTNKATLSITKSKQNSSEVKELALKPLLHLQRKQIFQFCHISFCEFGTSIKMRILQLSVVKPKLFVCLIANDIPAKCIPLSDRFCFARLKKGNKIKIFISPFTLLLGSSIGSTSYKKMLEKKQQKTLTLWKWKYSNRSSPWKFTDFPPLMKQLMLSLSVGYMLKTLGKAAFLTQWLQAIFVTC